MIKKKCVVCGKEYEYCGHCDKNPKINRWRNQYCSENCRDILNTVTDYVGNLIDVKTAKDKLLKLNININMTKQISNYITVIMSYIEKPKKEIKVKSIEEETKIVEKDEIKSIDEEKTRRRRRRRIKKVEE